MTRTYRVNWAIDIEADSPADAAKIARQLQLNPNSQATFFEVEIDEHISRCIDVLDGDSHAIH